MNYPEMSYLSQQIEDAPLQSNMQLFAYYPENIKTINGCLESNIVLNHNLGDRITTAKAPSANSIYTTSSLGSCVMFKDELYLAMNHEKSGGFSIYYLYRLHNYSWDRLLLMPTNVYHTLLVYNNELYASTTTSLYKFDDTNVSWTFVCNLPGNVSYGNKINIFAYNNAICVLGTNSSSNSCNLYIWDGSNWNVLANTPFLCYGTTSAGTMELSAKVGIFNNELYVLYGVSTGSSILESSGLYKLNSGSWSLISTSISYFSNLGYSNQGGFNYKDKLVYPTYDNHIYTFDGQTLQYLSIYTPQTKSASLWAVDNNIIHCLGGNNSDIHYLIYSNYYGKLFEYNNNIYLTISEGGLSQGSGFPDNQIQVFELDKNDMEFKPSSIPFDFYNCHAYDGVRTYVYNYVEYNNCLYMCNDEDGIYRLDDNIWTQVLTNDTSMGFYYNTSCIMVVFGERIHFFNGKKHWSWDNVTQTIINYNELPASSLYPIVYKNKLYAINEASNSSNMYEWEEEKDIWILQPVTPYLVYNSRKISTGNTLHFLCSFGLGTDTSNVTKGQLINASAPGKRLHIEYNENGDWLYLPDLPFSSEKSIFNAIYSNGYILICGTGGVYKIGGK